MSLDAYTVAIQALLKACQDGKPQHELWVPVCDTPRFLVDQGFEALPIAINGRTVDKVHFDHGITKRILERLPAMLGSPQAVFVSSSVDGGAVVVVSFELKGPNNIIIPLHRGKQIGRDRRVNAVASIYDKRPDVIAKWRADGLLLWEPPAP